MNDFNFDFSIDFAGGIRVADFNFDFNNDFARVSLPPVVFPPSEYIVVPPSFPVQVPAEYRTVHIQPEDTL